MRLNHITGRGERQVKMDAQAKIKVLEKRISKIEKALEKEEHVTEDQIKEILDKSFDSLLEPLARLADVVEARFGKKV